MKMYVSKFVDVEFMDVIYLIWEDGKADHPIAKLSGAELQRFISECQRAYCLPVNAKASADGRARSIQPTEGE